MDKVLNKIICFLSCFIIILGLFISCIFVKPVFALEYEHIYSINNNTYSVGSYSTIVLYGSNLGLDSSVNENIYYYARVPEINTYSTFVGFYLDNGAKKAVALVDGLSSDSYMMFYSATDRYGGSGNGNAEARFSSVYNIHYGIFSSSYYPSDVYYFDSLESLLSNFVNGDSFTSLYDGLNIPRGYFARIEFRNNSVVDSKSISLTTNWPDYRQVEQINQSQQFKYDGGSSAESVLSYGGFSPINYTGTGNADIFGGHKSGVVYYNGNYTKYLYIINPVFTPYNFINTINMNFNGGGTQAYNSNITLHDPDGIVESVRIYAISESIGSGLKADYDVDDNAGANAVITNGGLAWADDNGSPYIPPLNGNTGVSNIDDSNNFIDIIENAFNNLVEKIQHILSPAIGYFNTLLNSFNDFIHWLSNLWSWLPAPIVTLIEAVLYVSISVGLIKLVLK